MHKAWNNVEEVPYCFSWSSIKFQTHTGQKFDHFDKNWAFPDCNSSVNSPMALKLCTKLEVALKNSIFFKVIHQISRSHGTKNTLILTRIERFRTVTSVWIHWSVWDDAQSFKCNVEEAPYNFSRSSIQFQSHTGWKIDDLNPIWVRLLGRSQLSNPPDLPCWDRKYINILNHFNWKQTSSWNRSTSETISILHSQYPGCCFSSAVTLPFLL